MRAAPPLLVLTMFALLGGCESEPDFDSRYEAAKDKIDSRAAEIDAELQKRAMEDDAVADERAIADSAANTEG